MVFKTPIAVSVKRCLCVMGLTGTGMSYPISGQNPGYKHAGYDVPHKM
jgi:hypothetical protein